MAFRVKIPSPLPFEKCKFYPAEDMSYRSRIDSGALVRAAQTELSERDPEVYKVLLLALGAGLRRSEIDTLTFDQVDFAKNIRFINYKFCITIKQLNILWKIDA